MTTQPDAGGFLQLWPTTMLQRRLPGYEAANRIMAEMIVRLGADNEDLTTDYLSKNFFAIEHPAVRWLRECVRKTAVDYLQQQGVDYAVQFSLHGWANINRFGDYHDSHNHPHSYLSGTYYVVVPEQSRNPGQRKDLSPGAISFYDPRPQANMTAIRGDRQIAVEHTIVPQAGLILLWPSFLHHFVHPNFAHEPRISVSFNVVLKWSDDHLPQQSET